MTGRSASSLLGVAWLLAAGCGGGDGAPARAGPDAAAAAAEAPARVGTAPARPGSIAVRVTAPGSLAARRESRIAALVSGRLAEVAVAVGDRVEAGEVLFRIDPEPHALAAARAEAGLDLARAEAAQGEADLARAEKLHARDVLAAQEVDRLRTALRVARARERERGEAVALARRDLEATAVRAPFAGSVSERLADEGTVVTAQPPTAVVVLQETTVLEARVGVAEAQLGHVRAGDRAELFVEGLPEPVRARVEAVADSIDPASRTYLVRLLVPNPERALKAGAFLRAEIEPAPRAALLVPREALRSEGGEAQVLRAQGGRAVLTPVVLGALSEEEAEVLHGLAPGDRVIVGPAARALAPGAAIRPADDEVASK
jgi:multidrug efflux system membrane fusion protein